MRAKDITISKFLSIPITLDETAQGGSGIYLGPTAIDVDEDRNIYLLKAEERKIEKYSNKGNLIWVSKFKGTILDFKYYRHKTYAFNGENIFILSAMDGKVNDTIDLKIPKNEITKVVNVSKFYGKYLFINKAFLKGTEKIFVFDLEKMKLSARVPKNIEFYPITNCTACKLDFIRKIFSDKEYSFVDQSDKYLLYSKGNEFGVNEERLFLFDKQTGEEFFIEEIPFFRNISFTTNRYALLLNNSEIILGSIYQEGYTPKRINFHLIKLGNIKKIKSCPKKNRKLLK